MVSIKVANWWFFTIQVCVPRSKGYPKLVFVMHTLCWNNSGSNRSRAIDDSLVTIVCIMHMRVSRICDNRPLNARLLSLNSLDTSASADQLAIKNLLYGLPNCYLAAWLSVRDCSVFSALRSRGVTFWGTYNKNVKLKCSWHLLERALVASTDYVH